jgi:hypothetical protein
MTRIIALSPKRKTAASPHKTKKRLAIKRDMLEKKGSK